VPTKKGWPHIISTFILSLLGSFEEGPVERKLMLSVERATFYTEKKMPSASLNLVVNKNARW